MDRSRSPLLRARRHNAGDALVEFAISLPFLVMMAIGTFAVGVNVDRHLTVSQLVRNAGNMYGRGVDFSVSQNQDLLLDAATGMQMTTTGGLGVIYLSTVVLADSGQNLGLPVVVHRIGIGNPSIFSSSIGTPTTVQANGDVQNPDNDLQARAQMPGGITLTGNERIFVAECYHQPVDLLFPGFFSPAGIYSRAVF